MAITFTGGRPTADQIRLLRKLADDLERMTVFKPREELEAAMRINPWRLEMVPKPALRGVVHQHPLFKSKEVLTSELFAIDRNAGWARTLCRFYLLGPAPTEIN